MHNYQEELVTQLILALMEATGRDEIRVTEKALVRSDPNEHLMMYRDDVRFERVYRRIVQLEVIDGEEAPAAALAIEARS